MIMDNFWDCVTALIELFNTLIIIIPALIGFIYYKCKKINIIELKKSSAGVEIAIQNITKNTLFITNTQITYKIKRGDRKEKCYKFLDNNNIIELKPNQIKRVPIDYELLKIEKSECKKIIVTIQNKSKYKKRIK